MRFLPGIAVTAVKKATRPIATIATSAIGLILIDQKNLGEAEQLQTWRRGGQSIAPKDGAEFQGWVKSANDPLGWWETKCRHKPETEPFEIWDRVDYDGGRLGLSRPRRSSRMAAGTARALALHLTGDDDIRPWSPHRSGRIEMMASISDLSKHRIIAPGGAKRARTPGTIEARVWQLATVINHAYGARTRCSPRLHRESPGEGQPHAGLPRRHQDACCHVPVLCRAGE